MIKHFSQLQIKISLNRIPNCFYEHFYLTIYINTNIMILKYFR